MMRMFALAETRTDETHNYAHGRHQQKDSTDGVKRGGKPEQIGNPAYCEWADECRKVTSCLRLAKESTARTSRGYVDRECLSSYHDKAGRRT